MLCLHRIAECGNGTLSDSLTLDLLDIQSISWQGTPILKKISLDNSSSYSFGDFQFSSASVNDLEIHALDADNIDLSNLSVRSIQISSSNVEGTVLWPIVTENISLQNCLSQTASDRYQQC